jgi:predicted transcriptional regulator
MPRPRQSHPTPAELEVLQVLWDEGPATVRQVMERLNPARPRGYTTVMSLLDVMHDKGLLKRKSEGRAFVYAPKVDQNKTLGRMVQDLLSRAFQGSSSTLVSHLLDQTSPDPDELKAIRAAITEHERRKGKGKS